MMESCVLCSSVCMCVWESEREGETERPLETQQWERENSGNSHYSCEQRWCCNNISLFALCSATIRSITDGRFPKFGHRDGVGGGGGGGTGFDAELLTRPWDLDSHRTRAPLKCWLQQAPPHCVILNNYQAKVRIKIVCSRHGVCPGFSVRRHSPLNSQSRYLKMHARSTHWWKGILTIEHPTMHCK